MLRLYAGRENIDKERFIYEHIAGETLVIVPDQYTLVAEEQALRYMGTDCLFDTEILSMNRLGLRLLTEKGTESVPMLDKYGRFMLLGRLIKEHRDEFDIFRHSAGKVTFTEMLNDFISQFKQQNCSLDEVEAMLEEGSTDPILRAKLEELSGVIRAYEGAIAGRYTDSEDYIAMYVDAIRDSALVRGKAIWVYGYDSITPKFMTALLELAKAASQVSFIVNRSDFGLDEQLVSMLMRAGREQGIEVSCEEIGLEYALAKSETIRRIESGLWNDGLSREEMESNRDFVPEDLTLLSAANPYYEAESAAAYIWHLVRDLGYKMREIQVIANDETTLHPIIRRIFEEYGLPVFMDASRSITDTAPVAFIVDLLWFVVHKRSSQYLFAMLKTGLAGYDADAVEDLENYVRNYHIRGSMWDKDFKYGEDTVGTDVFRAVNGLRADIIGKVRALEELVKEGAQKDVAWFTGAFREYLREVWKLDEAVEAMAQDEELAGLHEEAQRTVQSYTKALQLLDQIVEITGDAGLDPAEFTEIYVTGLTDVKVGVIPPAVDGLSIGTMIRTRPRPVRAVVVIGANEGVLPMSPSPEGLFSVDEKEYFKSRGFELGVLDDIKMNEENSAMYRILSRPSEKLYISWSASNAEGGDASPSSVIESLLTLFPRLRADGLVLKDTISAGWGSGALTGSTGLGDTISTPDESLRHLMGRIKDTTRGDGPDPLREALLKWYADNRKNEIDTLLRAAAYDNDPKPLGTAAARSLFGRRDGTLVLSASSIGSYFDCPFKFYVDRGLRPREEREFTGDSRSIGDLYHECLMSISRKLVSNRDLLARLGGDDVEESPALQELEQMVSEELDRIAGSYRGGLFISTGSEEFRLSWIKEICAGAARAMAVQLAQDSVLSAEFEEGFRRGGRFAPVKLTIGGEDVYVEGKIDRCDVLDVEGSERVRVIDYKTGKDTLNVWKMRNGYKMQLMIYMISVTGNYEPAGMFYFNISDPIEGLDDESAKKEATVKGKQPEDLYKLKGTYVSEPGVLSAMPESVLAGKKNMSRAEYDSLRADVIRRIEETAGGILKGRININPLKEGRLVCSYCSYNAMCRRDHGYTRNYARELPPEPKKTADSGEAPDNQ